jgi:adenylate kinase family enzyme
MLKTIFTNRKDTFIKRWPKNPKVVFFAAPNSFQDELIQRFSIDMGLPVISMKTMFQNISE